MRKMKSMSDNNTHILRNLFIGLFIEKQEIDESKLHHKHD